MDGSKARILKAFSILLFLIAIIGIAMWILVPAEKMTDIKSLDIKEIRELADSDAVITKGFYKLSAGEYEVLGQYYENTITVNSVQHYEDVTYAYYTIRFDDKNGEPVVMTAKTKSGMNDLDIRTSDITGKFNVLRSDLMSKMKQQYSGDPEPENIVLYETQDIGAKIRTIGGETGLVCLIAGIGLTILSRREEDEVTWI